MTQVARKAAEGSKDQAPGDGISQGQLTSLNQAQRCDVKTYVKWYEHDMNW